MSLVIDSSVAVDLALDKVDFGPVAERDLLAPTLLLSESASSIHALVWRRAIPAELGDMAMASILAAPIRFTTSSDLLADAWSVADRLGWAKTYDAEFVALARRERCPLLTLDRRLARSAGRIIEVISPSDL